VTTHPFDRLPLAAGGALLFTPCPGTKDVDLATALDQLRQTGAAAVITLMPEDEMARFGADTLPTACAQRGLTWFHLPVEDDAAPAAPFETRWSAQRQAVHRLLDGNATVAIHCRGGSGRTGLMAAILLLERGHDLDQAVAMVQGLRPNALKQPAQRAYLVKSHV
jgi:protein-tyrosine phosphatase